MTRPSFYCLEFSVLPGGARKKLRIVRATLEEICDDLDSELRSSLNLYLLCSYGARLSLAVYQAGVETRSIDLLPLISVDIDGYPTITFSADGAAVGYDFTTDKERSGDEDSLSARLFGDEVDSFRCSVAWEQVEVDELVEPIVEYDALVNLDGDWLDDDEAMSEEELLDEGYVPYGPTERS